MIGLSISKIYWDFPTPPSLRIIENGLEKRKYLVGKGVVDVRGQMGQESSQTDLR